MPLPDANMTIAAALYGACVGYDSFPKQAPKTAKATKGADDAPESQEDTLVPPLAPSWDEAPASIRNELLRVTRFLHDYAHSTPVASLDRQRACMALVDMLKDSPLKPYAVPHRVLVEIFVSAKQALS
jgi:hypothetical protein